MHPLIVSQTPFFFLRKCSVSTTVCQYKYHRFLCICIPALPKKPWWYPTVFSCHVGKRLPGVLCWAVSSARSYGCWICACIAVLWGGTVILGSRSCCCNERPLFFLLLWFPCVESLTSFPEVFWIFFFVHADSVACYEGISTADNKVSVSTGRLRRSAARPQHCQSLHVPYPETIHQVQVVRNWICSSLGKQPTFHGLWARGVLVGEDAFLLGSHPRSLLLYNSVSYGNSGKTVYRLAE